MFRRLAHGVHNVASSVTLIQSNNWLAENVATLAGDLAVGLVFAWLVLKSTRSCPSETIEVAATG